MSSWRPMLAALFALALCRGIPAQAEEISQERGFSIHEADAEAGLHPEQPAPTDEKVMTTDGHAYWLRRDAILAGQLTDVSSAYLLLGQTHIQLTLTPEGARLFSAWTKGNVGHQLAYVLNGRIIAEPVRVMEAITSARKLDMLVRGGQLEAMALEMQLRKAISEASPASKADEL